MSSGVSWVQPPFFHEQLAGRQLNREEERNATEVDRHGFVLLPVLIPNFLCLRRAGDRPNRKTVTPARDPDH